ncbi:MAG: hypothetical protein KKA67_03835 [Spirochaetes bacterium]|nr:hypothetical protein [Spirochaetota bacterium]MBU1079467.1 hypothetical protein [Spirochaetota bacterium]
MRTTARRLARPASPSASLALALLLSIGAVASAQGAWPPLGGDRPVASIAESSDIRKRLWEPLLSAQRSVAKAYKASEQRNAWGSWSVSVETRAGAFYVVVSPERGGAFPAYAQGSWIVKRSDSDGSFLQAKIMLRSDPGTFARVYPDGSRSRIDVVAYGGVLYREVPVPLPFEELVVSPFSRIRALTSDVIAWDLFSPDPGLYRDLVGLAEAVRERLPGLRYADDGAIDADGRSVYIATLAGQASPAGLNCSGFVKWLVDGMLRPMTGSYLSVSGLRDRMIGWRGSSFTSGFEESLDPFFGLDWSRALAKAAWSTFYPSLTDESPISNDVDDAPFALRVRDSDPVNGGSAYEAFSDNFDDAGIDVRGLKATLFLLASREPGRFYLAQFNAREKDPPRLRRYYHIAALFPYFDDEGVFRVAVFESAAETSLEAVGRRGYEFVKLVRMPAAARFEPQALAP